MRYRSAGGILVVGTVVFGFLASAQPFQKQVYPFAMLRDGQPVEHPFTGGFYNPAHQFVDIDGDGDVDLFILEMNDGSFSFYRNGGTAQNPQLRFEIPSFTLPVVRDWFRFADIDNNGTMDLLTSGDSVANSVTIYKNTGSAASPQFTLFTRALRDSAHQIVDAQLQCIPALADIDGDGDLDFFSLNPGIGTINFYQNIGTQGIFLLAFRTSRWQNIQICTGCLEAGDNPLHGPGSMYFADVDADNDFDLFYGDLFDPGLFFYRNNGAPCCAQMDSVSGRFPQTDPILTAGFNQPTLVDIDGDGDKDLFISVLPPLQQVDNFWFYRNTGTPLNYHFVLETKNFLQTFDVGLQSSPALVDIDGDGDLDLFVGDLIGRVAFLRNTGTSTFPVFVLEDTAFISNPNQFGYIPQFADLDGDGDYDMVLGHFFGNIEFYRNVGTPTQPQFQRELSFFDSVNVGNQSFAAPAFFDIDNDGDLDLFVGKQDGRIAFFRNGGNAQQWQFVLVTSSFQNINVGANSRPQFVDVDGDGKPDLLAGSRDGGVFYYHNDGPTGNPTFTLVTSSFGGISPMQEVAATCADIDGDGDMDMFVGNYRGGMEFYRNQRLSNAVTPPNGLPLVAELDQNYPNPFNPITHFGFRIVDVGLVILRVYDILGQEVATLVNEVKQPGEYEVMWDASGFASGVYLYQLQAGSVAQTKKLVLLR
jgi:hypothetical protein